VVFTIADDELKILLVKRKYDPFKGCFALPGGYVNIDEELEDAVKRELLEETGVTNIFLKELHAYGKIGRDPRGRIITIPFLALINSDKRHIEASTDAEAVGWFSVYDLPKLAFDHKEIVDEALTLLRYDLTHSNIAFQLMPEFFTLTELQKAYEIILDKELDKRNFRKKLFEIDMLNESKNIRQDGAHRPARLYSFSDKKYKMFD
jgi:8-oxo-dGTP diphosphatase